MFIQNKYLNWYNRIICSAKGRSSDPKIYYEKHHIVPRSLGGSNDKDNLVKLTAREHYVCHLLLVKFMENNHDKFKMMNAVSKFMNARSYQKRILTSREYQICREYARECAVYFAQFRKPRSRESIEKTIQTNKLRYGGGSSRYGVKLSTAQKQNHRDLRSNRDSYETWFVNANPEEVKSLHREWAKLHSTFVHNNPSKTEQGKRKISLSRSPGLIITPWGNFACRLDFEQHPICGNIGYENLFYLKHGLDRKIRTRAINRANLPKEWKDKTWREVGFDIREQLDLPSS